MHWIHSCGFQPQTSDMKSTNKRVGQHGGLSPWHFLFLSSTLFSSRCWHTMTTWFNTKCLHQMKENFFSISFRIRSREWWPIFVCWIHCYFPDCYLEIISYFFDPQVKRLYVKNNNISYLREWYGLIPSPGVYWVLISESILALSG